MATNMSGKITIPNYEIFKIMSSDMVVTVTDAGKVSDGYHSFDELYEHRHLLYLSFLKAIGTTSVVPFRAKLHHDGNGYDGWFLVGALIDGKQISYHLPDRLWNCCNWMATYDKAPIEFDGHSSLDVLDRLREWLSAPPSKRLPRVEQLGSSLGS